MLNVPICDKNLVKQNLIGPSPHIPPFPFPLWSISTFLPPAYQIHPQLLVSLQNRFSLQCAVMTGQGVMCSIEQCTVPAYTVFEQCCNSSSRPTRVVNRILLSSILLVKMAEGRLPLSNSVIELSDWPGHFWNRKGHQILYPDVLLYRFGSFPVSIERNEKYTFPQRKLD